MTTKWKASIPWASIYLEWPLMKLSFKNFRNNFKMGIDQSDLLEWFLLELLVLHPVSLHTKTIKNIFEIEWKAWTDFSTNIMFFHLSGLSCSNHVPDSNLLSAYWNSFRLVSLINACLTAPEQNPNGGSIVQMHKIRCLNLFRGG